MTQGDQEPLRGELVDAPRGVYAGEGSIRPEIVTEPTVGPITDPGAVIAALCAVLLPGLGALLAWVIAPSAKRRIRASEGLLGGQKLAVFAQVWAAVNLLLCALVVYLVFFVLHWALTGIF